MSNPQMVGAQLVNDLSKELSQFADTLNELARAKSAEYWLKDSGSAEASITAYSVGVDAPQKNFNDPVWQAAQSPGYVSPVHFNPAENFVPVEAQAEIAQPAVALTVFVGYADALEAGVGHKHIALPNFLADSAQEFAGFFNEFAQTSINRALGL